MGRRLDWEKAAKRPQPQQAKPQVSAWWWVPNRVEGPCHECHERMARGQLVAYSHLAQTAVCELCGEKYSPRTSRAAAAQPREKPIERAKSPRTRHEPRRWRTLQTLSGPVRYVDSGWTEAEWDVIAAAMARRA